MVFYVVGDSSSVGMKRRKKGCKKGQRWKKRMNAAALEGIWKLAVASMPQHWRPNAAALGKRQKSGKVTESRMPQHWGVNAMALVPEAEKNKEFDFY